ncbi:MAG: hypothetical protein EP330_29755 [Deltaproteobacteria bacterium]|nr:MAG: hypothetical protein EP330_29755 [Deltaproteobacteria bacterium]
MPNGYAILMTAALARPPEAAELPSPSAGRGPSPAEVADPSYRARLRRRQRVGGLLATGGLVVGSVGVLAIATTWDPGPTPGAILGGSALGLGGLGMVIGLPMMNTAAMREATVLERQGFDIRRGSGTAAWVTFGASLPAMAFFPVGVPLYVFSLVLASDQVRRNERAASTPMVRVQLTPRAGRSPGLALQGTF